jgi:hypothetical protein
MARRASTAIASVVKRKHIDFRNAVRNTFFGEDTIRVVPESIEANRALASISIEKSKSSQLFLSHRHVLPLQFKTHNEEDDANRDIPDLEENATSNIRSTSRAIGAISPTTPGSSSKLDDDPLVLFIRLKDELRLFVNSLSESAEKDVLLAKWG